jgi:SAM-dependent methyltransferase
MTVTEKFDPAALKSHYGAEYFQGAEYMDYLGDRAAHQKTLAGHLRRMRPYCAPGARVLEVGCAHGFFLELCQSIYPDSVGLEVSPAAVAHAQQRGLPARLGDLVDAQFNDVFDGVCLWDTLEHLPNPDAVLCRASELLKPGGHLFLTTGDFGAWLPRVQGLKWRQIHPPTHLFYFTRQSLRLLCGRMGLDVLQFGTVTVHRRLGSALQALDKFHRTSFSGRLARFALRAAPQRLLDWEIPLNLGDTLWLVARKRD